MPNEPIISVSGLRGIVGESLTPDVTIRYISAFCATLPVGSIVVTRDGRATGTMLAGAVHSAVVGSGRTCLDGDVAATPTTGLLVRTCEAAGGVQISASHNPAEYNGFKIFSPEGRVISAEAGEKVLDAYREGRTAWAAHDRLGNVISIDDTISEHLQRVLAIVDRKRICDCGFRVVLDANHGAGSVLGEPLLDALGCRVSLFGAPPHGRFAHSPEPLLENLTGVAEKARKIGAAVTFCQDPDADRLAIIDENGRYLGEESTLALCIEHVLGGSRQSEASGGRKPAETESSVRSQHAAIITNCSTSRMSQDIAEQHGADFFQSAVGEANVVDAMREHDAVLGGEGNGGVIDPRVGWVRDSFVGIALVLNAMAETGKPISELADALPQYAIHKTKVALSREKVAAAFDKLAGHFGDATSDRLDGLRLDWPGKWLLIRASNTEPVIRIIAEAATAQEAERLCRKASEVLA